MKAYLESYGCAHNESDARIIRAILENQGIEIISSVSDADFVFLNTCGVKHTTEMRMLSRIRELSKESATLVVCGCLPRINEKAIRGAAPNACLLSTDSLHRIPELLEHPADFMGIEREDKYSLPLPRHGLVAVLQISEGCLGDCTYCGVKLARGRLHSYPKEKIVSAAESAIRSGAREICLTSEDTGCYGFDINSSLPELVSAITSIEGEFRVRVGMMNPNHALKLLPQLIEAYASEKVYKFAHLPVQSGSDRVLHDMNRFYTAREFEFLVSELRNALPGISIVTDVIIGFPTETEEDFAATMSLLERTRPNIVNVSKFGPRPGTEAARMKKLPSQIIKARSSEASRLANLLSLESNKKCVGKNYEAVALLPGPKGGVVGRTPNYTPLVFEGVLGKTYRVKAVKPFQNYVLAEPLSK